jgi:hypothetical protein
MIFESYPHKAGLPSCIFSLADITTVKVKENMTGTMVRADFLTTLVPDLAILCVSLPKGGRSV